MAANYFIFDMDETLAELFPVYYFVASLRLKESCDDDKPLCDHIPGSLLDSLNKAYHLFVQSILDSEASKMPLGIFRPGILSIMQKLNQLQKAGKIRNVVIYSNNGHLESLEFIRDIIHRYLKTNDLIKECIHWNHHMRGEERQIRPGAANKTWNVLRNILVDGNCKAPEMIEPNNIYFFDDLDHPDLQRNLGTNYYKVPGYDFKASFDRIANIYRECITKADVNSGMLLDYIVELFINQNEIRDKMVEGNLDKIIRLFRMKTPGTVKADDRVPGRDTGILMMESAISRVQFQGGKRYTKRVRHSTKKKTRSSRILSRGKKKLKSSRDQR
jgi:hypothetical protein